MNIMNISVKDFFEERKKDLEIPCCLSIDNCDIEQLIKFYSLGKFCFIRTNSFYVYKDEAENEYIYYNNKASTKSAWNKINKMIENKEINRNVKEKIIKLNKEEEKREKYRVKALKNPSLYFLKTNPEKSVEKTNEVLYDFVCFWYRLTQCRGMINKWKTDDYINKFLGKTKFTSIKNILKKFEKRVIEDGGIVKVSSY